jgi:hypothetical protein
LIPLDRPECRRGLERAEVRASRRFFNAALDAAARRDRVICREALRMARTVAPGYSRRPHILAYRCWKLVGTWFRGI